MRWWANTKSVLAFFGFENPTNHLGPKRLSRTVSYPGLLMIVTGDVSPHNEGFEEQVKISCYCVTILRYEP